MPTMWRTALHRRIRARLSDRHSSDASTTDARSLRGFSWATPSLHSNPSIWPDHRRRHTVWRLGVASAGCVSPMIRHRLSTICLAASAGRRASGVHSTMTRMIRASNAGCGAFAAISSHAHAEMNPVHQWDCSALGLSLRTIGPFGLYDRPGFLAFSSGLVDDWRSIDADDIGHMVVYVCVCVGSFLWFCVCVYHVILQIIARAHTFCVRIHFVQWKFWK